MMVLMFSIDRESEMDELIYAANILPRKVNDNRNNYNNLRDYVARHGNNLGDVSHFIIDLEGLTDTDSEFIEAANKLLQTYDDMRLIILADGENGKKRRGLLRSLYNKGVYDILTVSDNLTLELERCLAQGRTREQAAVFLLDEPQKKEAPKTATIPDDKAEDNPEDEPAITKTTLIAVKDFRKFKQYISVGVCGTEPHMGATHAAISVARFLSGVGFKVAYLEAQPDIHKIFTVAGAYPHKCSINQSRSLIQCFGIDIYSNFKMSEVMANNYDVYVFDLGVLTEAGLTAFMTKDVRLLIGGVKPWELPLLNTSLNLTGANEVNLLLNFAPQDERERLRNTLGELRKFAYFPEHELNPFVGAANRDIYKEVFREYVKEDVVMVSEAPKEKEKKGLFKFLRRDER